MNKVYGDFIRAERIKHNLSQVDLASLTGISRMTISSIENGSNSWPSTRRKLEAALKSVSVSAFYDLSK